MEKVSNIDRLSWKCYTEESSIHGVKYLRVDETSMVRRVLWLIIILGGCGYFIAASYQFLKEFSKTTLITKINIKNARNLTFPTVTICNRNTWKKSMFDEKFESNPEMSRMWREIFTDMYSYTRPLPPPENKYNWTSPPLKALVSPLSNEDMDRMISSKAYTLNESLIACMLYRHMIPCHKIFVQTYTDCGYCVQFNSRGDSTAYSAGRSGGIGVLLDTKVHDYYIGPHSYSEGFFVAIHDANDVPLMSQLADSISPGFLTTINVYRKEINRWPPPADAGQSDCHDAENLPNPLHYHKGYSYSACYDECLASHVINKCGCRNYFQPAINNTLVCSVPMQLNCSRPALREFPKDPEILANCNCKNRCYEIQYTTRLSHSKYPSFNMLEPADGFSDKATQDAEQYMRKNHVMVNIGYGQLAYEKIDEKPAHTGEDLIANLGGTLGVCLGASLLSIIELMEFIILKIGRVISDKIGNKSRTTPTS